MISINEAFSTKNIIEEWNKYLKQKTDIFSSEIKIPMGTDGVDYRNFDKNKEIFAKNIHTRINNGNYYFSPFREVDIPKSKIYSLKEAYELNKIRTLSIATIKDVIVQKITYNLIYPLFEKEFRSLKNVSFAYRQNKSSAQAVRKIYNYTKKGYLNILDADIKKFFDKISHKLLKEKVENLLKDESILKKLLIRFISADRVPFRSYESKKTFYFKKPNRIKREEGIPQGGILSGLLANLFLHEFDLFVEKTLKKDNDIAYIRYADDFLVLCKTREKLIEIKEILNSKLKEMELEMHTLPEKTKIIDLNKENLEYVGFEITKDDIRIKEDNITIFKERVFNKINSKKIENIDDVITVLNKSIFNIVGNEAFQFKCENCEREIIYRGWMAYFLTLTDIKQFKEIDKWIRKTIFEKIKNTQVPIKSYKNAIYQFPRLEKTYYRYKKDFIKKNSVVAN